MEKSQSAASGAAPETAKAEPVVAQPVTPAAPAAAAAPAVSNVVYVEKKSGGNTGKCILIGCAVLLLCCCITVVIGIFAPQALVGVIMGQNKGKDATLTRVTTTAEIQSLITAVNAKEGTLTANNTVILTLDEKELLALIVDGMQIQQTPDKVGVKITPGDLKMDIELGTVIRLINASNTSGSQIDVGTAFDNVYGSLEFGTTADGKNLTIKKFSTGNSLIDSLIPADVIKSMEKGIQDQLAQSFSTGEGGISIAIENITFSQGSVSIELKQADQVPATTP
jgi:hypothetical protein